MNLERAAMQGRLAEAEHDQTRLQLRIESAAKALCRGLNTALIDDVRELEIPQLDEQFDVLKSAWGEYLSLDQKISRLQRELK